MQMPHNKNWIIYFVWFGIFVQACSAAHPTRSAFESVLAADYVNDLNQVEKQFGPKGKAAFEQNLDARAAETAASFIAVGKYRRVLINEWYFMKYPWSESIRVLSHELTHTAQSELVDGGFTAADRWLVEGFADWVSCGPYFFSKLSNIRQQSFAGCFKCLTLLGNKLQ